MKRFSVILILLFCLSNLFAHDEQAMQVQITAVGIQEEYQAFRTLSYKDENLLPALMQFKESLRLYKSQTNLSKELKDAEAKFYSRLEKNLDNLIEYLNKNYGTENFNETVFYQYKNKITENILALHDLSHQNLSLENRKLLVLMQLLIVLLFISAVAIIILALSYKQSSYEKKLAKEFNRYIIQAQEDERKIISHELHDTIAQELKGIKFLTSQLSSETPDADSKTIELSKRVDSIASQAMINIRTICYNLTPPELEYNKLSEAILLLSQNFSQQTSVECPAAIQCREALDSISSENQLHIFRIIQECLTNIAKHSKASEASIIIRQEENNIHIIICDNGIGFNSNIKNLNSKENTLSKKHLGLLGIKDRVKAINGKLEISSEPDFGTEVKIVLPVSSK